MICKKLCFKLIEDIDKKNVALDQQRKYNKKIYCNKPFWIKI